MEKQNKAQKLVIWVHSDMVHMEMVIIMKGFEGFGLEWHYLFQV
jgi:hypothetical protein